MYPKITSHFPESKAFGMCLFFLTHITSIRFSIFDFGVLDSVGVYLSWLGMAANSILGSRTLILH